MNLRGAWLQKEMQNGAWGRLSQKSMPAQEASEAGVLGRPQFKTLSCGLALAGFAHIMCLHPYWCVST